MSVFSTSKYINKESLVKPIQLTIAGNEKRNVGTTEKPEEKWCLSFEEVEEFLPLNKTRGERLAEDFGSYEMDDWAGKKIEVFHDPTVMFGGKKVGGVAVKGLK